ncbi:hypothetical protein FA95DRAFT_1613781 [Auriscalpium vulgare]|uniref:Uncharacterized protein n=1 Tax=Auriscalpium vulgare TaxID=40419 RepID=A0ACB8R224_9AGAM|nr:hypothetical protein FA95DRAFT_1613781 [Auriscalpium vulgare]
MADAALLPAQRDFDFFATLTPPSRLPGARCHADFVDVKNGDRVCRVAHDDESAEVKRVRRCAGDGAEYETLWGCCGRTVEGGGDQGPPDGWCYEGKHMTDVKRARSRADSALRHPTPIAVSKNPMFASNDQFHTPLCLARQKQGNPRSKKHRSLWILLTISFPHHRAHHPDRVRD